eukprot:UN21305
MQNLSPVVSFLFTNLFYLFCLFKIALVTFSGINNTINLVVCEERTNAMLIPKDS